VVSDITTCSRSGSIGGLVTWAKAWRKYRRAPRGGEHRERRVVAHQPVVSWSGESTRSTPALSGELEQFLKRRRVAVELGGGEGSIRSAAGSDARFSQRYK
jgi:hypothetical protein